MKKIYNLVLASALLLSLTGCGDTTDTPIVEEIEYIEIKTPDTPLYSTTNSYALSAVAHYSNDTTRDVTEAVLWETDFSKAALSYGTLTPKVNGDNADTLSLPVTISYRGAQESRDIELYALEDLNISDDTNGSPLLNQEYTFTAVASYSNGDTNVSIGAGNSNNVSWDVNDTNIAEITSQTDGVAKIKFLKSGTVSITVKAYDESNTTSYTVN